MYHDEICDEFDNEEIDRVVINKDIKKIKIVLENGKRIIAYYNDMNYID